jgi:hypothetical protein
MMALTNMTKDEAMKSVFPPAPPPASKKAPADEKAAKDKQSPSQTFKPADGNGKTAKKKG